MKGLAPRAGWKGWLIVVWRALDCVKNRVEKGKICSGAQTVDRYL